jgi:hypothetical protein
VRHLRLRREWEGLLQSHRTSPTRTRSRNLPPHYVQTFGEFVANLLRG